MPRGRSAVLNFLSVQKRTPKEGTERKREEEEEEEESALLN